MFKDKIQETQILSIDESYELLSMHGIRAISFQKSSNLGMYHEEILLLAKYCGVLLMHHSQSPQIIMGRMETAMIEAYTAELEKINSDIQHLFNRRKMLSPNTSYGEQEIAELTFKINELTKRKTTPTQEIIQGVIYGALAAASKNNGAEVPDELYINLHGHSGTEPVINPDGFHHRSATE